MPTPAIETVNKDSNVITNTLTGCVKWFNNRLNYGFITVLTEGEHLNEDIFVHQSNIKTAKECFRTLFTGECVNFELATSDNEKHPFHAVNVRGFNNLMCEVDVRNVRAFSNLMYEVERFNRGGGRGRGFSGGRGRGRGFSGGRGRGFGGGRGRGSGRDFGGDNTRGDRELSVDNSVSTSVENNEASEPKVANETPVITPSTSANSTQDASAGASRRGRGRGRGRGNKVSA